MTGTNIWPMWPNSLTRRPRDRWPLALIVAALLIVAGLAPVAADQRIFSVERAVCAADQLSVQTEAGIRRFQVEIADTVEARARGLMHRTKVPVGTGMLFIYDRPVPVSFWMRNTLVPLDLVFIDAAGIIRHVHPMARPLDETPIPGASIGDPRPERLMVLEVAGGEARRLGLAPGQPVAHPRLDATQAAWPCR